MTFDIIGSGIGGLTTAIALEQKGFKVRIFEQASQVKPVGAGIILANNAMQVFDKLGLRQAIEEKGNSISSMNITDAQLKVLSKIDLAYFEQKHKVKNIAIHRGDLQEILINKLRSAKIELDHKLSDIVQKGSAYELTFENGASIQSSNLIAADGLNSMVRQKLFPNNSIRQANQICWRGISDYNLPEQFQHELNEAWGGIERFGFVQIAPNKVYWYALKSFERDKKEFSIYELAQYFGNYHPTIKGIIDAATKEQIHIAAIADLQPTKLWYKENVCLIGDAAHATTPNMGQGACQAIEDAYVLSECLAKYDVNKAFETFQTIRLPKAHLVVNTSWTLGKMAHLSNPLLIKLRNQIMRMTPNSINRKQSEKIFELDKV